MKPKHVYNIIIQTSNALLWDALINPEITQHYFFKLKVKSEWRSGARVEYFNPEGEDIISGEVITCQPISKIVYSFRGHTAANGERDPYSRVCFEIEELHANACKLTVVHDDFESENTTYNNVGGGWPTILSGLKTYLETGKPLIVEADDVECGG